MIRHTQTIFGDGTDGSTPGNCMQTAVASLLDLPMEDVPHFVAMPEENWWTAFLSWLNSRGLSLTMYAERFSNTYAYHGAGLVTAPLGAVPSGRMVIGSGMAARGFRHVVLLQDGELVHDPHPSGAGLLEAPDEVWLIDPLAVT